MARPNAGGITLLGTTLLALLAANSPAAEAYHITASLSSFAVNDVLMTLFFFVVGLEIKREILVGELSARDKALQPVLAALGGIAIPALLFLTFNWDDDKLRHGWAIPTATDIAFALGVLRLVGKSVPVSIKVLLTAVAILDDLAAILIIALFYSGHLHLSWLLLSAIGVFILKRLNDKKIPKLRYYAVAGLIVWIGFLGCGIHPTLAGVVTALFIPMPVDKLEHKFAPWVVFGVLPVFALVNAGLSFEGMSFDQLAEPLPLGIALGLLIGKPIGILGGLAVGHITKLAPLARNWRDYAGMAVLCGIGFTMSLFIGDLAFAETLTRNDVKLGVLSASLLSAVIGWKLCRSSFRHK
jgi:NhaA family Na+:H+ antiporter